MEQFEQTINIVNDIDSAKCQCYDRLMLTIKDNLENLSKEEILMIFSEFVNDLKHGNRELINKMYQTKNDDMALTYAHITRNHMRNVDAKVDNILIQNQQQSINASQFHENSLPGNIL